jgi:hypothetical protein
LKKVSPAADKMPRTLNFLSPATDPYSVIREITLPPSTHFSDLRKFAKAAADGTTIKIEI